MISTSPAKSSPLKDVILEDAQEDSDAKASDDVGADFEVISASEAKDAPDEEESEAESEEAEEEGDEEECEAEDEEAEAEEDESVSKYASARDEELLKSASIYKSAYDSKPASTAKRQKWSEKLKSPSRAIGSFGFAPAFEEEEE